ncbi:MAG: hypothetical protein AAFZ15_03035 [Bacteroidota bacterium]
MKNLIRFFLFSFCVTVIFTNCQQDNELDKVGTPITVDFEFKTQVTDDLSISFEEVTTDSRCPCNAACITAGLIGVKLKIETNGTTLTKLFTLPNYDGPEEGVYDTDFMGYNIELKDVLPFPCNGEPEIDSDYSVEIMVTEL